MMALVWKEWREHRGKMLGILLVYLALVGSMRLLFTGTVGEALIQAQMCLIIAALVIPGFVAMGTLTEEQARRTADTLRVLPVKMGRVFLVKCFWGLLTLLVPLVAAQMAAWFVIFPDSTGQRYVMPLIEWCVLAVTMTACMYAWTLALGVRCRSEFRVVLVFIAFLFFNVLWLALMYEARLEGLMDFLPLSLVTMDPKGRPGLEWAVAENLLLVGPLLAWACWGFGRAGSARRRDVPEAGSRTRVGPFAGQRFPVVWKTWREYRRLVLGYLGLALLFVVLDGALAWYYVIHWEEVRNGTKESNALWRLGSDTGPLLVVLPAIGAYLMAIVLGVDLGVRDFENRLERFWESRPIPAADYFRKRFALGAAFTLAMAVIPALVVYAGRWLLLHPNNELGDFLTDMATAFLLFFVPQIALLYGLSALLATLSRRRVVPMVFGVAVAIVMQMIFANQDSQLIYHLLNDIMKGTVVSVVYIAVMALATTGLGWVAALSIQGRWRERLDTAVAPREPNYPVPK